MNATVAAIDCGTNSTRLLIAGPTGETLAREAVITRLGEGVDASGRLSEQGIERTLEALGRYRELMDANGAEIGMASATQAAREATNAEAFLGPAAKILGFRPQVLSGEEEGRLSFAGATAALESQVGTCVVFDVGGGSTELMVGEPGSPPRSVRSVPLGCVRLTERYLREPVSFKALVEASDEAEQLAEQAVASAGAVGLGARVVGLAGTVTSLSAMEQRLEHYDPGRIHRSILTRAQVERWVEVLSAQSVEERAAQPGLEPKRAPVILGGALAVAAMLRVLRAEEMLVSESDILDGMVDRLRKA